MPKKIGGLDIDYRVVMTTYSNPERVQATPDWRLFENTVKLPDKFLQESRNLRLKKQISNFITQK